MTITETGLPGVRIIDLDVYADERGDFRETWNDRAYCEHGLDVDFVQDNLSRSKPGVLRGLHFQNPQPQGKLVSVFQGEVYDVAVDIRADSDTFGEWIGRTLSAENGRQLYVPEGFAHGFLVTGNDDALFHYKCTNHYCPEAEGSIRWNDSTLSIDWPIKDPILSEKDQKAEQVKDTPEERFDFGLGSSTEN